MKNVLKIVLVVLGIVILAGGVFVYATFFREKIDIAKLSTVQGNVEINEGKGWSAASEGMKLSTNDKIRTNSGKATVVLFESVISQLEPNTEVEIASLVKENPKLKQTSGSTWNKFTKITGVGTYDVETPTTTATVRGTEFGVNVNPDEFPVLEGTVVVDSNGNTLNVGPFQKAVYDTNGQLIVVELSLKEKQELLVKAKQTLEEIKKLRENIFDDNRALIDKAMQKYQVTESQLRDYLDKIDAGEIDDAALMEKSPVKVPAMEQLKKINDEVKKQLSLINSLEESIQADTSSENTK
jgi:hypothetical protein